VHLLKCNRGAVAFSCPLQVSEIDRSIPTSVRMLLHVVALAIYSCTEISHGRPPNRCVTEGVGHGAEESSSPLKNPASLDDLRPPARLPAAAPFGF